MQRLAHTAAILAGIASRRRAFTGPLFANLSLANICNLKCRFCSYSQSRIHAAAAGNKIPTKYLDFNAACRFLDDLNALGTRLVILLGEGEPLLYPKLIDLAYECRKRGIQVEIFTNGLLLDPALSGELIKTGVKAVKISVMADSAEHYEELRQSGRKNSWERMWTGIHSLVEARRKAASKTPSIVLHHMICGITGDRLSKMIENTRESGADTITFTPLVDQSSSVSNLAFRDADVPDICRMLREIDASLKNSSLKSNAAEAALRFELGPDIHKSVRCWIGWLSTRIQTNGDVLFCHAVADVAGNIHHQSFREIWQSEKYKSFRRIAAKPGGITAPELHSFCSYCCYAPHFEKVRQLSSAKGILRTFRTAVSPVA